jgi:hypothetical protein
MKIGDRIAQAERAEPQNGGWISVKERLPDIKFSNNQIQTTDVVLAINSGTHYFGYFMIHRYDGSFEFVGYDDDMDYGEYSAPTHWMPLPEAPEVTTRHG